MAARTTEIIVTGRSAGAVRALDQVGVAARRNATAAEAHFNRTTTRIGSGFHKLDSTLGRFGLPFTGALGKMGDQFTRVEQRGRGFGTTLANIGKVEALAAAAGLAAFGAIAVHAALDAEQAHQRLTTAIRNAGGSLEEYEGDISKTSDTLAHFGFENKDVEDSIARLIPAAKDVGKAIELQGLAADIARGRNIDLMDATNLLVKVEAGRYAVLGKTLGLSKAQVAGIRNEREAVDLLQKMYGGAAANSAETFTGKIRALQAEGTNFAERIGNTLVPQLERLISGVLATIDAFDSANEATHGWLGKLAAAAAAVPLAAFALSKLSAGLNAVGNAYISVGQKIGSLRGVREAEAAAVGEAAAAHEANAAALTTESAAQAANTAATAESAAASQLAVDATAARIAAERAAVVAMAADEAAQQGLVAATIEHAAAETAVADATFALTGATIDADAALVTLNGAQNAAAASAERLAVAEGEAAAATAAAAAAQSAAAKAAATEAGAQLGVGAGAATGGAAAGLGVTAGALIAPLAAASAFMVVMKRRSDDFRASITESAEGMAQLGDASADAEQKLAKTIGPENTAAVREYRDLILANADAQTLNAAKSEASASIQRRVADEFFGAARAAKLSDDELRSLAQTNQAFGSKVAANTAQYATAAKALDKLREKYGDAGVKTLQLQEAQKGLADLLAVDPSQRAASYTEDLASARADVVSASRENATVQNAVNAATEEGTEAADEQAAALQRQADAATTAKDLSTALSAAQKKYSDLLAGGNASERELAAARRDVIDASRENAAVQDKVSSATQKGADAIKAEGDAAETTEEKISRLKDGLDKLFGVQVDVEKANLDYKDGLVDLAKTLKDNGATLDVNTEKGRSNREAIIGQTEKAKSLADALITEQGNLKGANVVLSEHVSAMVDTARQAGLSEQATRDYIAQLFGIPESKRTKIETNADLVRLIMQGLKGDVEKVPGKKDITITANTSAAEAALNRVKAGIDGINAATSAGRAAQLIALGGITEVNKKATGGPVGGGELYLVGEEGPELFVPRESGTIIPNNKLGGMFADGGKPPVGVPSLVGEAGAEAFVPSVFTGITVNQRDSAATSGGGTDVKADAFGDFISAASGLVGQAEGNAKAFFLLLRYSQTRLRQFSSLISRINSGRGKGAAAPLLARVLAASGEGGIDLAQHIVGTKLQGQAEKDLRAYRDAWLGFDKLSAKLAGAPKGAGKSAKRAVATTPDDDTDDPNSTIGKIKATLGANSTIGKIKARAAGGDVDAMRPYLVGERGVEAFRPRNSLVSTGSGATINATFNINALDPRAAQQAVYDALRGWQRDHGPLRLKIAG